MVDLGEEFFNKGILLESEDGGSPGSEDLSGSVNDFEPESLRVFQDMESGTFLRSSSLRGTGFDLEVGQEIVSQDDDLLPGAVRSVVVRRDRVEGETAFQLTDRFFVCPTTGHEVPEFLRFT